MGLSENELWGLTPREFYALKRVWEDSRKPFWFMYAGIQASIHNAWMRDPKRKPYSPYDWLPNESRPDPPPPWGTQSTEEKMLILRQMLEMAAASNEGKETIN